MRLPAQQADRLRPLYEGTRVCVTGGAGFIGSHLIDALFALGSVITVLDDLSTSDLTHLAPLIDLDPERVRFVRGSVLEDRALARATEGAKLVFHLAALNSVPRSIDDPERTWAVNATGTMRVLRAATSARARRLVYAASSSAYGDTEELPKRESMPPRPRSPYAASKLAGEHLCAAFAATWPDRLDTASLRFFNIFGPRQPHDSPYAGVVPRFAERLIAGKAPVIQGDGLQTRDFTFVDNAALALLLAGARVEPLSGAVINVGAGERHSILDLARAMATHLSPEAPPPVHEPERAGDVRDSQADLSRARDLLGYAPIVHFDEGVARAADWYRQPAHSQ